MMQQKKQKMPHRVLLIYPNSTTRIVMVKAATIDAAERKALKRNPGAVNARGVIRS